MFDIRRRWVTGLRVIKDARWIQASAVVVSVLAFSMDAAAAQGSFKEGSFLRKGEYLFPGQWITDGCFFRLEMQADGNLVTYAGPASPENAIFVTDTQDGGQPWLHMPCSFTDSCGPGFVRHVGVPPGKYAVLQTDGNFVVYDRFNLPLWWTGTAFIGPNLAFLTQQDDGNLVIYHTEGTQPPWSLERSFPITTAGCSNPRAKKTVVAPDTWLIAPATLVLLPTADPWRCGYECAGDSTCKAWVYTPPGWDDPNLAGCWLATSTGSGFIPNHPGFTAGIVVTCDQNNAYDCTPTSPPPDVR